MTILLIITGVVCTMVMFNAVYPVINSSSGAMAGMAGRINDRIKSQVEIVQVACESDNVSVWVKNIGSTKLGSIEKSDVFLGQEGNFSWISYGQPGSPKPYWDYVIENDTEWVPTATLRIDIHVEQEPSGTYFVKMAVYNGVSDEYQFSN